MPVDIVAPLLTRARWRTPVTPQPHGRTTIHGRRRTRPPPPRAVVRHAGRRPSPPPSSGGCAPRCGGPQMANTTRTNAQPVGGVGRAPPSHNPPEPTFTRSLGAVGPRDDKKTTPRRRRSSCRAADDHHDDPNGRSKADATRARDGGAQQADHRVRQKSPQPQLPKSGRRDRFAAVAARHGARHRSTKQSKAQCCSI